MPAFFFFNSCSDNYLENFEIEKKTIRDLNSDFQPVILLLPDNSSIVSKNPTFVWTPRAGAISYRLEISTDPVFENILLTKTLSKEVYTMHGEDFAKGNSLQPLTYFWRITTEYYDKRVKSDINVFHHLDDDIIYVDKKSFSSYEAGNKISPFRSIQRGIEIADYYGKKYVYVSEDNYVEDITIRKGITLQGGFNSSNDWARDIKANNTTITASSDVAIKAARISAEYINSTVIDGFIIRGGNTGLNAGVYIVDADITLKNNIIYSGNMAVANGIFISSSNSIIENNEIFAVSENFGSSNVAINGIRAEYSNPIIQNNIIRVYLDSSGDSSYAIGLSVTNATSIFLNNNLVYVCHVSHMNKYPAYGLLMRYDSSGIIENNTICVDSDRSLICAANEKGTGEYYRNIFITNSSISSRFGFSEITEKDSNPEIFIDNIFAGFDSKIYRNNNSTNIEDKGADGILNGEPNYELDNVGSAGGSSGNRTLASGQTIQLNLFAEGFSFNDMSSWQIRPYGIADRDNSGGFTEGDSGADVSLLGF